MSAGDMKLKTGEKRKLKFESEKTMIEQKGKMKLKSEKNVLKKVEQKKKFNLKSEKSILEETSSEKPLKENVIKKKQIKKKWSPYANQRNDGLSKAERRLLKLKSKKHADVVAQLLPMSEILRRADTENEKRFEIIENILKLSKNKILDLCFAHDTSRIIESTVQHGTEAQRWTVFGEIRKKLRLLAKSRHGKFVLLKLMNHGAKEHRLELFKLLRGHVTRLVNHRLAVEVVDLFYNDYANATQRGELVRELFGNVHALKLADNRIYTLADTLSANTDKKRAILSNLNTLLTSVVTKGLTKYSIVQHVLLEYIRAASKVESEQINPTAGHEPMDVVSDVKTVDDTVRGKLLSLIELLVEGGHIVPMLHTREGVRVALHILWLSPSRQRRVLVKGLKTCISSIARDEHGHLFLIGLLDFVDDMLLLEKVVIKEILEDLELFCEHPVARKVLFYALSPRDLRCFSPQLRKSVFCAGDSNQFTKKPLGVRAFELRNPSLKLVPRLLQLGSDRLMDIFIGDDSPEGAYAIRDRGRMILLAELLVYSAPHHMKPGELLNSYHRSEVNQEVASDSNVDGISVEASNQLQTLRTNVFTKFVQCVLAPPFHPTGVSAKRTTQIERDEERMKRHKLAVHQIEIKLAQSAKPKFSAFESGAGNDSSAEANDKPNDLPVAVNTPFLELAEGQLFLRRLLQDGKKNNDFTLSRLIMKCVPPSTLCSWTRCNRSCFSLVNLYELGDKKVRKLLSSALTTSLSELSTSSLPGAKVLYKLLQNPSSDAS